MSTYLLSVLVISTGNYRYTPVYDCLGPDKGLYVIDSFMRAVLGYSYSLLLTGLLLEFRRRISTYSFDKQYLRRLQILNSIIIVAIFINIGFLFVFSKEYLGSKLGALPLLIVFSFLFIPYYFLIKISELGNPSST